MRALRLHGPNDLRVDDVPLPEPRDGEVTLEVEVALTGSADFRAFAAGGGLLDGSPAPIGRELAGIDTRNGTRVVVAASAPCGHCAQCVDDREVLCRRPVELVGAFAQRVLVPARIAEVNLHPVPRGLDPAVAALADPLACCLHAVERANVRPGSLVAVLGAGPIGLMICACVTDAGGYVAAAGGRPSRHALAAAFGARPADPRDADVVIEAAGTPEARRDALDLVQPGGTVLLVGAPEPGEPLAADAERIHREELQLAGASGHAPRHVRAALAFLASGAYPWERLVTHEVPLEGVAGLLADPPDDYLKAAVRP
ncbi:MAG TPA: zinc-binding dehydrogenase [Gaiellaceae bacterium]|nr:zinc-binding dehydrogenase [Gaiellaceae bacterium]